MQFSEKTSLLIFCLAHLVVTGITSKVVNVINIPPTAVASLPVAPSTKSSAALPTGSSTTLPAKSPTSIVNRSKPKNRTADELKSKFAIQSVKPVNATLPEPTKMALIAETAEIQPTTSSVYAVAATLRILLSTIILLVLHFPGQ